MNNILERRRRSLRGPNLELLITATDETSAPIPILHSVGEEEKPRVCYIYICTVYLILFYLQNLYSETFRIKLHFLLSQLFFYQNEICLNQTFLDEQLPILQLDEDGEKNMYITYFVNQDNTEIYFFRSTVVHYLLNCFLLSKKAYI